MVIKLMKTALIFKIMRRHMLWFKKITTGDLPRLGSGWRQHYKTVSSFMLRSKFCVQLKSRVWQFKFGNYLEALP